MGFRCCVFLCLCVSLVYSSVFLLSVFHLSLTLRSSFSSFFLFLFLFLLSSFLSFFFLFFSHFAQPLMAKQFKEHLREYLLTVGGCTHPIIDSHRTTFLMKIAKTSFPVLRNCSTKFSSRTRRLVPWIQTRLSHHHQLLLSLLLLLPSTERNQQRPSSQRRDRLTAYHSGSSLV
jgi:hypothetical protein